MGKTTITRKSTIAKTLLLYLYINPMVIFTLRLLYITLIPSHSSDPHLVVVGSRNNHSGE